MKNKGFTSDYQSENTIKSSMTYYVPQSYDMLNKNKVEKKYLPVLLVI